MTQTMNKKGRLNVWYFNDEIYYTMKEAAELIGVSYWRIQRSFRKGSIKGGIPKTSDCSEEPFHPNLVPLSYIKAEKKRLEIENRIKNGIGSIISEIPDYHSLPHEVKIQKVRESFEADKQIIANLLGVSVMLMDILEEGGVTHPKLAEKIGKIYKMSNSEIESMMPANYRKHGKKYDPDKYKDPVDIYGMNSDYFGRWRFKDEGYEEVRPEIFEEGTDEEDYE